MHPWGEPELFVEERQLYPHVLKYINLEFYNRIRPRYGSMALVAQDVSNIPGVNGGRWSRPDLAAIGVSKGKYTPTIRVEIYSFEVKLASSGDVTAVYESLSHRSFVNFSFLVWNRTALADRALNDIEWSCKEHGVGLIIAHAPSRADRYELRHFPPRNDIHDALVDEFIEERLSDDSKASISRSLQRMASPL